MGRDVNVFIILKIDRFVMKTTTKNESFLKIIVFLKFFFLKTIVLQNDPFYMWVL